MEDIDISQTTLELNFELIPKERYVGSYEKNTTFERNIKIIGTYLNDKNDKRIRKLPWVIDNNYYMCLIYPRVLIYPRMVRVLIKLWVGLISHWLNELKQF